MFISEDWGEGVYRYTISNGEYSASVLNLGAILQSFRFRDHDVVLGFDSLDGYRSQTGYMGQVVGPIANRIENGSFTVDGKSYQLHRNENGKTTLHSCEMNFGDMKWKMTGHSDASVSLSLVAEPRGGFDQRFEVMATYFLTDDGQLIIDYQVMSDGRCPINITNHAYFNLGDGDVRDTVLTFPGRKYVDVDSDLIAQRECDSIGTDYDFNAPHAIGERKDGKYDTCFSLDGVLVAEKNGLRLSMRTTMPAFQLYTAEFLSSGLDGKNGRPYRAFDGFALESSYYPNFMNRDGFAGAYVEPGVLYRSTTTYKLEEI